MGPVRPRREGVLDESTLTDLGAKRYVGQEEGVCGNAVLQPLQSRRRDGGGQDAESLTVVRGIPLEILTMPFLSIVYREDKVNERRAPTLHCLRFDSLRIGL